MLYPENSANPQQPAPQLNLRNLLRADLHSLDPSSDFSRNENPIFRGNVFSRSTRNVFGPVSLIPTRFLTQLRSEQTATKKPEEESIVNLESEPEMVERKFLLKNLEIPTEIDENTRESLETQRADRVEFVKMLMLATTQDNWKLSDHNLSFIFYFNFPLLFIIHHTTDCWKFFNKNVIFSH